MKKLLLALFLITILIAGNVYAIPPTPFGMPHGCTNGQVPKYNTTTLKWDCAADSTGGTPTFDAVATGTNTTEILTCGSGCTLVTTAGIFRIPNGASLPATCTVGDAFMDTDATSGSRWYLCEATNSWIVQGANPFGAAIDSSEIANGAIVNEDVNAAAAIAYSKLAALTDGYIIVGNGTNVPTAVAMSGDVTIVNTGATTIGTNAVALGTDTTGNYVATLADAGSAFFTIANSGTESAAVTITPADKDWGAFTVTTGVAALDANAVTDSAIAAGAVDGGASGEIADNSVTADDLAATLTFSDGDLIDLSGILYVDLATTNEGLAIPSYIAGAAPSSVKNYVAYDADNNAIMVYETGGWTNASAGSGAATSLNFVTTGAEGSLSSESVLTAGTGIDVTDAGGDGGAVTVDVDTTEIGTTVWGSGAAITQTYDASAGTDCTVVWGNNTATTTCGTFNVVGTIQQSGTGVQPLDGTLTALAGLTVADVSIIEGTGADAVAMVASGGNNYFLTSNSGNTALEFKTPANALTAIETGVNILLETEIDASSELIAIMDDETGTGVLTFATSPTFTTSILPASVGVTTIGSTSGEWGNVYVGDDVGINFGLGQDWSVKYDEATDDQLIFLTAATTATAITDPLFEIIVGAIPTADQEVFGISKGTQLSNTPLLTVDEDGDVVIAGGLTSTAADGSRGITLQSNTTFTPAANQIYFLNNVLKISENGTERDIVTPADTVTWTGTSHSFAGVTNMILPTATPDANGEVGINNTNETLLMYINSGLKTFDFTGDAADYVLKSNGAGVFTLQVDATGGSPTLNSVANPTGDSTITMDAGEEVNFDYTGAFTTGSQFKIEQVTGNASGGTLVEIKAADSDVTALKVGDGTNGIQVSQAGALTVAGTGSIAATTATLASTVVVVDSTDATSSIAMFDSATGSMAIKTDAGLTYAANTGILTATGFAGPLTGNVTGNASGTALTVTQAAQTSITSLGTLTALDVDNLNINGNTISATTGAVNITPYTGSAIVLDGTINVDAGVVTGATSITSTAFAGNLTGAVTGNAGTATALAANPTDCGANTYATTIAASGNLTCAAITNGSLDADLQTLAAPTAWRVFYSNGTSVITQLALGASGTYLMSNGASAAPTFETPSGSGDVTDVGNCTGGACGDGTSDGGTYIELYSASGNTRIVNTSGVLEAKTAAGAAYANFKAASISTEASDGYNKLLITNNTAFSPTAASMEMYPEGNIWKFNENGTEYASVLAPLAGPIKFTGPTAARSYALPDAAATILTNNAYVTVGQGGTGLGSGTSGGIPYYSSGNAMTSSAALTQYGLIVGGGAGATPYALTDIGTSAKVLHGNATGAPTWSVIASGDLPTTITGLTSVSSTGFTGALTGNASTATLAATSTVVDSTDTSSYVAIFDSATGSLAVKTDTGLTYNAGTGMLTATGFTGPLTGNVIGSAATLTTARTINGTSFNGSADIHNTFSKCVTIKGAVATDDFPVEHFPYAITITATSLYMQGSTALVGGFDECTGSGGICTTLTPFDTTDMTASAANTWYAAASAFENAAIAANNGIFWHTTSVTGTNTFAIACFTYTVD